MVSMVRNMTPFNPSHCWYQDLKFGPRMNIFGLLEPELWQFEVSCVEVIKMKGNQNNNKNSNFPSYQTKNSKETSNSHISGSSRPKISIWGPNSSSWCQLSDGRNVVIFLTILTLVLAGNPKILKCVYGFFAF